MVHLHLIAAGIILSIFSLTEAVNVINYGAIGDGRTDDSQAFLKAWTDICRGVTQDTTLYIPSKKNFLLNPVNFQGPCRSSITFQIMGNIVAPNSVNAWSGHNSQNWITFAYFNGLTIEGNGVIDGKGPVWWGKHQKRPIGISFTNCRNLMLKGTTHINSADAHISIFGCSHINIGNIRIMAPGLSPNTDGIRIGQSSKVLIHDSFIATGDDCIAISGGTSFIQVNRVTCGPGHGISIGSLGGNGMTSMVEEIHVRNCHLRGTTNGLRIKTWQGGSGYARKITFENIHLEAVANPIIIDQFYCIGQTNCPIKTSAVKVSDVTYNGVFGTSSTEEAVVLRCSQTVSCDNIMFSNIDIASTMTGKATSAECLNAHGRRNGSSIPSLNCLSS